MSILLYIEAPFSGNIGKQYLFILTQSCPSILLITCFLLLKHRCPAILVQSCRNLLSQFCLTIGTMFSNIEAKLFYIITRFSFIFIIVLQLCTNVASIFFCQC